MGCGRLNKARIVCRQRLCMVAGRVVQGFECGTGVKLAQKFREK